MSASSYLSAADIRQALDALPAAGPFVRRVVYHPQIGSTNDLCKQLACEGAAEGTLVVADEQTAGRGRMARRWVAPAASALLFSILLRPDMPPGQANRLTMLAGLAAAEGVQALTGLHAALKWPNDLLLGDEKCAGMLAELGLSAARLDYVVIGMGINVNFDPQSVPGTGTGSTSLMRALGRPVDRLALLAAITERLAQRYSAMRSGAGILADWRARLATIGCRVTVSEASSRYEGVAEDTDEDGALLVRLDDGTLVRVQAGDVSLRSEGLS